MLSRLVSCFIVLFILTSLLIMSCEQKVDVSSPEIAARGFWDSLQMNDFNRAAKYYLTLKEARSALKDTTGLSGDLKKELDELTDEFIKVAGTGAWQTFKVEKSGEVYGRKNIETAIHFRKDRKDQILKLVFINIKDDTWKLLNVDLTEVPKPVVASAGDSLYFKTCPPLSNSQIDSIKNAVLLAPLKQVKLGEKAVLETNYGKIVIRFFPDKAPQHCAYFKRLVTTGFYNCTKFHRISKEFVIQGGDILTRDNNPMNDGQGSPDYSIPAEFNDILHDKGILSMARGSDPNSAGSQFFICLGRLRTQHLDKNYSVFGKVVEGLDVVEKIGNVETTVNPLMGENSKPVKPVYVIKAYMII